MPNTPYIIAGIVTDTDGSTILANATVNLLNSTTTESLDSTYQVTTNSSGEYVIDGANLTSGVSEGDSLTVEATSSDDVKFKQELITADIYTGFTYQDMTMGYLDVLDLIKTILSDDWQSGRTDNITPTIDKIFNYKRIDLADTSVVLLYLVNYMTEPQGLWTTNKKTVEDVSVDIRTCVSRSHYLKVKNEVERILDANISQPESNSRNLLMPIRNKDLSDKSTGLWRSVIDVRLTNFSIARGSAV